MRFIFPKDYLFFLLCRCGKTGLECLHCTEWTHFTERKKRKKPQNTPHCLLRLFPINLFCESWSYKSLFHARWPIVWRSIPQTAQSRRCEVHSIALAVVVIVSPKGKHKHAYCRLMKQDGYCVQTWLLRGLLLRLYVSNPFSRWSALLKAHLILTGRFKLQQGNIPFIFMGLQSVKEIAVPPLLSLKKMKHCLFPGWLNQICNISLFLQYLVILSEKKNLFLRIYVLSFVINLK